ncbi:hypothetical protein D9M72_358130 [compost metagenome]
MAAVKNVALELSDDERQPCDLGRKVAQFYAAKVGQRDLGAHVPLISAPVYLCLDCAHLLISDHQKVTATARWVKHADAGHALAQVQELDLVVPGRLKLGA